jgi:phosphatidylglycerophosphatase A
VDLRNKSVLFVATGCYLGYLPVAPGTFGSVLGVLLYWALMVLPLAALVTVVTVFTMLAVWIADVAEKICAQKDPGCIVIDEIAGILVTFIGVPFEPLTAMIGFIIFRIFDIFKPYPIGFIERKLQGGAGIVVDDVVAGVLSNLSLRLLLLLGLLG